MPAFLFRRLLHAVFVVWGVVTVVFFLVRLTGDPAAFLVDQTATQEEIAHVRRLLGLDRPLLAQYADFLRAVPRGDFGTSIQGRRPAMAVVLEHFWPATVELALAALVLSTVLAIPLGVLSATHKDGTLDHLSRVASLLLQPALTLAAAPLAQNVRLIRSGMLDVLHQDYVRTARAKGVAERGVVYRHALRNAAIPVITVTGLSLGFMLSGAVVVETVFSRPGMGRLIVQAVPGRDFPVIQAGVFVFALVFVGINLVVDVLYSIVDPRVRLT
jgi:peptide/nickel transport system permease protein